MTDLQHFDNLGTYRFVTFSTYRRLPLLHDDRVCSILTQQLEIVRQTTAVKIMAYVIMPEHLHLLLLPPARWQLGTEIGKFKSTSASRIIAEKPDVIAAFVERLEIVRDHRCRLAIWTPRCMDHNCRDSEAALVRVNYCHANPVRRGLVTNPLDWKWSSYRWFAGERDVPLRVDEFSL